MIRYSILFLFLFAFDDCMYNPIIKSLLWPAKTSPNLSFLSILAFPNPSTGPITDPAQTDPASESQSTPDSASTPAKTISLNSSSYSVLKNNTVQIIAKLFVDGAETSSSFLYSSSNTSVATVSTTGLVTAISNGPAVITVQEANGSTSASAQINVYSGYIYATMDAINSVAKLTINSSDGTLTADQTVSVSSLSPNGIGVDPYGKYAYTGNFDSDTISQLDISSSDGSLTFNRTVATSIQPRNISITPDGKFLFLATQLSQAIDRFSINPSNGNLTFLGAYPIGINVTQNAIDPTGKYLVALYPTYTQVSSFRIDQSTGNLSLISTSGNMVSSGLFAFHPSGKYLYVGSNPNITALSFDVATGAVAIIGTVSHTPNPNGIVAHPNGKFLYSTNISDGTLSCFAIDQSNGTLTLSSNIGSGGGDVRFLAIEPSGRYAYLAQKSSPFLFAYLIDQTTGALSSINSYNVGDGQWNLFIK